MDFTGPQIYYGLAGFHLIRDDEEEALGLPHGERDIPLTIVDRAFKEDGSFHYPAVDPSLTKKPGVKEDYVSGVLGDCILVNGAPWPELEVTNTRYRFRILDASNARRYRLALDPAPAEGASFVQVGSDQAYCPSRSSTRRSRSPRPSASTSSSTFPSTPSATRSRWSTSAATAARRR